MTFEESLDPHVHDDDEPHAHPVLATPAEPAWMVMLQSNLGLRQYIVHAEHPERALVAAVTRLRESLSKRQLRKLVISKGAVFGPAPYAFETREIEPS